MYKCYHLPAPTFRDWLFGIHPTISVFANDEPGNKSVITLKHRGYPFGRIEVTFKPDPVTEMREVTKENDDGNK